MYRNFLAMEAEELLRSYPVDGAVLMGGCDKTTPGLVMGAISMGLPFIFMPAGPMLKGNASGETLGSGTDMFKGWSELRAGTIDQQRWEDLLQGIARSPGTCMTMGTAATMMSAVEALGLTLPGASSIPAPDSRHAQMATATGKRIVDMVWEDLRPSQVLTDAAFDNAVTTVLALGGSTNALVHLIAMARRAGCTLDLDRFDALARRTPLVANIRPAGKYLMEDFYYAGGLRALMEGIRDKLNVDALTVNGRTLGENIEGARVFDDDVILPRGKALYQDGSLAILRGNLCPDGAVIKPAASEPRLHRHKGRAVVFEDYHDLAARIDDPNLDVDADSVLVLKNAGPLGGPGMPEWGQLPIPKKLLQKGVRDMLRISDARMSGTSFGACVLHVAPESFIGGPLALVQSGDLIEIDIPARRLDLLVSDDEMARRRKAWIAPPPRYSRGYGAIFTEHVTQANEGCDFAVLANRSKVPEPDIF
jgi:dihydroxy-acid dehydratase